MRDFARDYMNGDYPIYRGIHAIHGRYNNVACTGQLRVKLEER